VTEEYREDCATCGHLLFARFRPLNAKLKEIIKERFGGIEK